MAARTTFIALLLLMQWAVFFVFVSWLTQAGYTGFHGAADGRALIERALHPSGSFAFVAGANWGPRIFDLATLLLLSPLALTVVFIRSMRRRVRR
ncbi:MAG TPA: hypothetical protein VK139_03475 [Microbacteriaceae bacterium]|nr:hypothetical protein [Microbacteriaceae bacterium]